MKISLTVIFLGICSFWDLRKKQIWWPLPVFFLILAALVRFVAKDGTLWEYLAGSLPGCVLLLFAWISQEAIGYGDGIVVFACGALMGIGNAVQMLILALCFSAVWSGFLLAVRKADRKESFAFVPFMFAAELVLLVTGWA